MTVTDSILFNGNRGWKSLGRQRAGLTEVVSALLLGLEVANVGQELALRLVVDRFADEVRPVLRLVRAPMVTFFPMTTLAPMLTASPRAADSSMTACAEMPSRSASCDGAKARAICAIAHSGCSWISIDLPVTGQSGRVTKHGMSEFSASLRYFA